MKYREQVPIPGQRPLVLPWPMTDREAARYVTMIFAVVIASLVIVVWLSLELIESSLWRLAPAVVWALALRQLVVPAITRSLTPEDLDRRWAAMDGERRQDPPIGSLR